MKIKKTLLNGCATLTSLSLLTISLTSCIGNTIDSKYKVDLNDDGLIFTRSNKDGSLEDINYSIAIKNALSRSTDWQAFKTALANELIYQWFIDRMDTDKNNRNEDFKFDLEKYKKEVDNTYDEKIQSCKSMYGTDYDFYFKNIYLAPNGGTTSAYKHKLLVDKIANEFVDKAFNTSYFSLCSDNSENILYPNIYAKAEKNVSIDKIRNPKYWDKIGFYARSASNFFVDETPKSYDKIDVDWLAKHPDGDYAIIQQYTFDKWFEIEKPFFSDAALFKYSLPKYVAGGKLSEIYNASFAGTTISDNADEIKEEFPFFGADQEKNGTKKFKSFLQALQNSDFNTPYFDDNKQKVYSNGTFAINLENTDDSQSILLCLGKQMFGNTSSDKSTNALYTQYALAAGNLLQNLLNCTEDSNTIQNVVPSQCIYENIEKYYDSANGIDNPAILANFWYTDEHGWNPLPNNYIKSYLNLDVCYGNLTTTDNGGVKHFHCPIFNNGKFNDFKWFYGDNTTSGVQYITNAIQINDFPNDGTTNQPWIMELNQSGVHVQTIDGYTYIKNHGSNREQRLEALKNVVKYRLLQKETDSAANSCISAQMYGENGFLKTYFRDNLADLVIGMSLNDSFNIFRNIASYKLEKQEQNKEDNLFLYKIYSFDDEKMGNAYVNLYEYLEKILSYDVLKKEYDALIAANKKIYEYRQSQITNSKEKIGETRTIGSNGLLAPIVYEYTVNNFSTHDYDSVNRIIVMDIQDQYGTDIQNLLDDKIRKIRESKFIVDVTNSSITPNIAHAFSPQIKQAKQDGLNRYYYKSSIVDQLMYASTGSVQANANAIKFNCYKWYQKHMSNNKLFQTNNSNDFNFVDKNVLEYNDATKQAFTSSYKRSKLITGTEKKLSSYTNDSNLTVSKYWNVLDNAFAKNLNASISYDGEYCDDNTNLELFKATIMYLLSPNESTYNKPFDRFYEILNTRISEDDIAFVGYLTKGYANLNNQPITDITTNDDQNNIYNFSANVDNIFDQTHMSGGYPVTNMEAVKLSGDKYWNVVNKKWNVNGEAIEKPLSGFLGIQSNWSNQLTGQLQTDVFGSFGKITTDSYDLSMKNKKYSEQTNTKDGQYYGCFQKFAGEKNYNDEYYKFSVSDGEITISQEDFMNGNQQALKLAYKIANCNYFSDLKQWAENIANAYPGYSYFKEFISNTSTYYTNLNKLKIDMLKLLPCGNKASEHAHSIDCFKRLKNVEVHTNQINPKYTYVNNSNNTAYRLLLTQINKSDLIERKLTPIFNTNSMKWEFSQDCPLTEEEFWNILFELASETSVHDLAISNVVDNAFGSDKLIVYDARVYNQFSAAWIKNWVKKPIDESYV